MSKILYLSIALAAYLLPTLAFASGVEPYQFGFQDAASPVAERLHDFYSMLFYLCVFIVVLVAGLLLFIILRFNAKTNPEPSKRTHNTPLEIIWTVIPVIIITIIAVPSIKLLYYMDRTEAPEMTIKVTGYQWYWGYSYPDYENIEFLSYMIEDKDIDPSKGQQRLLSTDNVVVLPINTNIQILVTAEDVIHSLALPAFGIKIDAIPGRLNETWVRITKPGTYYGQCSELCGARHAYMPIEIKAVTEEEFEQWLNEAKEKYALNTMSSSSIQIAQTQ